MSRRLAPAAVALAALAAAADPAAFRFSRPIEAPSGWTQLDLPDDVLDACRPGLPDLRIEANGVETPFTFRSDSWRAKAAAAPLTDVESSPKKETTALLDRGPRPPLGDRATFLVESDDFLKPVVAESSEDRTSWREIARGSIFAAAGTRMLTLRFAPNDRRYWRFTFDDRNGDPIRPASAVVGLAAPEGPAAQERPLGASVLPESPEGRTVVRLLLPASNLSIRSLRLDANEPAFARPVRVYERVLFRDEIERRLLTATSWTKAPGSAPDIDLPPGAASGRTLELEIDDGDSPPLTDLRASALVDATTLLFFAPAGSRLSLRYGSGTARSPRYDVGRALRKGSPEAFAAASLGPVTESAAAPSFAVSHGSPIDPAAWSTRRPIGLPKTGSLAYCDLPPDADLPGLRIVDEENRQVPYLIERWAREVRRSVRPRWETRGSESAAEVAGLDPSAVLESIEVEASAPAYFSREVFVEQELSDARGVTGVRTLAAARWERRPGDLPSPIRIPLGTAGQKAIRIRVANGDNPPLALAAVRLITSVSRIDFAFRPGSKLLLLSGNPEARAPRYDFALLAAEVLAAPAERATLGPAVRAEAAPRPRTPVWLWGTLVAAVLLVALALARTLRKL